MKNNILFDIDYLIKNKKEWLATIFMGVLTMIGLAFSGEAGLNLFSNIGSILESIAILATLFIASSVLREERLKNLDKKLTVIFEYQNKRVMMCENAYLAGTSDIRQWGQSIGQLMNHGARLHFEPFIQETNLILEHKGKQYIATIPHILHSKFCLNLLSIITTKGNTSFGVALSKMMLKPLK